MVVVQVWISFEHEGYVGRVLCVCVLFPFGIRTWIWILGGPVVFDCVMWCVGGIESCILSRGKDKC